MTMVKKKYINLTKVFSELNHIMVINIAYKIKIQFILGMDLEAIKYFGKITNTYCTHFRISRILRINNIYIFKNKYSKH